MEDQIRANVLQILPTADFIYSLAHPRKCTSLKTKIRLAHQRLFPQKSWLSTDYEVDLKSTIDLSFTAEDILIMFRQFLYLIGKPDRTKEALDSNHEYQLKSARKLLDYYRSNCSCSNMYRDWKPGDMYHGKGFTLTIMPGLGLLANGKVQLMLNLQQVDNRVFQLMLETGLKNASLCIGGNLYFDPLAQGGMPVWKFAQPGSITADIKSNMLISRQKGRYFLSFETKGLRL